MLLQVGARNACDTPAPRRLIDRPPLQLCRQARLDERRVRCHSVAAAQNTKSHKRRKAGWWCSESLILQEAEREGGDVVLSSHFVSSLSLPWLVGESMRLGRKTGLPSPTNSYSIVIGSGHLVSSFTLTLSVRPSWGPAQARDGVRRSSARHAAFWPAM